MKGVGVAMPAALARSAAEANLLPSRLREGESWRVPDNLNLAFAARFTYAPAVRAGPLGIRRPIPLVTVGVSRADHAGSPGSKLQEVA